MTERLQQLMKAYGQKIYELRQELKRSMKVFAAPTGLHRTTISSWERGLNFPSLSSYEQLVAAYPQLNDDQIKEEIILRAKTGPEPGGPPHKYRGGPRKEPRPHAKRPGVRSARDEPADAPDAQDAEQAQPRQQPISKELVLLLVQETLRNFRKRDDFIKKALAEGANPLELLQLIHEVL